MVQNHHASIIVILLVRFQYQIRLYVNITQWWVAPKLSLMFLLSVSAHYHQSNIVSFKFPPYILGKKHFIVTWNCSQRYLYIFKINWGNCQFLKFNYFIFQVVCFQDVWPENKRNDNELLHMYVKKCH